MILIYKVTNIENEKIYIGQTRYSLQRRKSTHLNCALRNTTNMVFHSAIRKYGADKFKWEMLEKCKIEREADEREIYYIKYFNSLIPSGYNIAEGGGGISGYVMTDENKNRASERMKIRNPMHNPLTREKMKNSSVFNSHEFKRKMKFIRKTNEFKKKQRNAKLGNKNPNFGKIYGNNNPARRLDVRKKLSKASKGENNPMAKTWKIITPLGKKLIINNLPDFCEKNDLSYSCMKQVAYGKIKQHKGGWKCMAYHV